MTTTNKPIHTIRSGSVKASVWWNTNEKSSKGGFHSVQITRTYKDEQGGYHDTDRFNGTELLQVAYVAQKAYEFTQFRGPGNEDDHSAD